MPAELRGTALPADVLAIERGIHGRPFDVLGPHFYAGADGSKVGTAGEGGKGGLAIRAFLPGAVAARIRRGTKSTEMSRLTDTGFFEAVFPRITKVFSYRFEIEFPGETGTAAVVREDPYRFEPLLSEFDLHLLAEGTHYELHRKLGAHARPHAKTNGVSFAVWAPNARRVSVVGNFNRWNGRAHPMRLHPKAGVWELFVPGLGPGEVYKYEILTLASDEPILKADPVGQFMEVRPDTASIVVSEGNYAWGDGAWIQGRAATQAHDRPLSIYEVHVGSWRRRAPHASESPPGEGQEGHWLTWRELAHTLVPWAAGLGYTHLELLPITEHPFDGSWGYQTVGYFAPSSRFGTPDDFRHFVDAAHQAGLGVILDWVPAHFPKDAHGLGWFDGTHLYEHADPRKGHHPDWQTYIFNFNRPEVCAFLLASALYWVEEFHIDGLRVDAVASMLYLDYSRKEGVWVPNRFGGRAHLAAAEVLRRVNALGHERVPGVLTFAEESTNWPGVSRAVHLGGLGFDYKWNMGWMHDTLEYMRLDPVFRRFHHGKLTFSLYYAWSENYLLPLSHDEVVHGKYSLLTKMPGDVWKRFANLRALHAAMIAHPGKKLVFMGAEFGQWREWHHDRQLDWWLLDDPETGPGHRGLIELVRALHTVYRSEPALHEVDAHWDGFEWLDFRDVEQSVIAFVRHAKNRERALVVVANFTPLPRHGYRIGVPQATSYREILNSDAPQFGGSGVGNPGPLVSEAVPCHGQGQSLLLSLPPLGVLFLTPDSQRGV